MSNRLVEVPPQSLTDALRQRYLSVRRFTERLCEPLSAEDQVIQSMPDASPTRWHIAHTTWFFETFVLLRGMPGYRPFHPQFTYLFNSYYNAVGRQPPRAQRGMLSRPSVSEAMQYRAHVDRHLSALLRDDSGLDDNLLRIVELGIQHEQQHQELILTDIKHALWCNPLRPSYREATPHAAPGGPTSVSGWTRFGEGIRWIGSDGPGFIFDNEGPRHRVFVETFELAHGLVTNAEFLAFMKDDGYARPELWLSEGWATVQANAWSAPLYWEQRDGAWQHFTMAGLRPIVPDEPVCHVSYFEADAFARWSGARLPTEAEWEIAAEDQPLAGTFAESEQFHPSPAPLSSRRGLTQLLGDVWEWTGSQYLPYPRYQPASGALGEYNGKFMCNQFVLRGGSCATPRSHIRAAYRNFFPPAVRWQFTGLRLARYA